MQVFARVFVITKNFHKFFKIIEKLVKLLFLYNQSFFSFMSGFSCIKNIHVYYTGRQKTCMKLICPLTARGGWVKA